MQTSCEADEDAEDVEGDEEDARRLRGDGDEAAARSREIRARSARDLACEVTATKPPVRTVQLLSTSSSKHTTKPEAMSLKLLA